MLAKGLTGVGNCTFDGRQIISSDESNFGNLFIGQQQFDVFFQLVNMPEVAELVQIALPLTLSIDQYGNITLILLVVDLFDDVEHDAEFLEEVQEVKRFLLHEEMRV